MLNFDFLSKNKYKNSTSYSVEYAAWYGMLNRCFNESNTAYHNYGGRGISVCERWIGEKGFDNFYQDMGARISKNHSIDRIDNNGNYCPENCRWATNKEQCRNRRTTKLITIDKETKSMAEWCEIYKADYQLVKDRIRDGLDPYLALTSPKKRNYLYIGDKYNSWTIISKVDGSNRYVCRCVCGKENIIASYDLIKNKSTQCKSCRMIGNTFANTRK